MNRPWKWVISSTRVLSLLAILVANTSIVSAAPVAQRNADPSGASFVPDEILIQYTETADETEKQDARTRANATRKERLADPRRNNRGELELAKLQSGRSVEAAIRAIERHPGVLFAEPNWIYTHDATSDDPYYTDGSLWGMYGDGSSPANQYGSQAAEAWAGGGVGKNSVHIGIIDEGVDRNHPDLQANMWSNPGEIDNNGVDDDGNGYVDDKYGWDFYSNDKSVYDGTSDDHGTLGAKGGNDIGVAGVNWNVTLIPAKFLGPSGGYTSDAVKALDYLRGLKAKYGLDLIATNNSWGGGGFSQALYDAIERSNQAGILFVAAAGNSSANTDSSPHYPSSYNNSNLISVASITSSGALSSFSNYGATTVDLGAPGSSINSTLPGGSYGSYSGTSMATPHVAGAVALCRAHLGIGPVEIKNRLLSNGIATSSLSGKSVSGKRLNAATCFESSAVTPPSTLETPTNLTTSVVSSSQINLAWADRSSNETGFKIERCQGANCSSFAEIASVNAGATSYQNTSLTASTSYSYRVRATNGSENSAYSNSSTATTQAAPVPAPTAPGGLAANAVSSSRIDLSWQDASNNEAGFKIERCQGAGCSTFTEIASLGAGTTTYQNTGLSANTSYTYRVRAYNTGGSNVSGTDSATTQAGSVAPTAPTNLDATAVSRSQINLVWSDSSGDETGFKIERCRGTSCTDFSQVATVGANVRSYSDRNLSRDRDYRYRVRAYNSAGNSTYSNLDTARTLRW
jgi:subtilisin family serine protease